VLGREVLKLTYATIKQQIEENNAFENQDFLDLFRIFCNSGYSSIEVYNSFIKGFGEKFEQYEPAELVSFCISLGQVGL
jgi:hypothetical protein